MNQPIRYIIAIRPPAAIIAEVKEMKRALKKAVGGFYNSVNSEAHITLFEFYAYDEHYPALLNELARAVGMLAPFDLEFQGFNHFATTGAFYIQLTSESSKSVIEQCIQFRQTLSPEILNIHTEGWTDMFETPHMTIGRRLRADWIEKPIHCSIGSMQSSGAIHSLCESSMTIENSSTSLRSCRWLR